MGLVSYYAVGNNLQSDLLPPLAETKVKWKIVFPLTGK
jgi:hypothetical protein